METPSSASAETVTAHPAPRRPDTGRPSYQASPSPLDRALDLSRISGYAVTLTIIMVVAAVLRLVHLSRFALDTGESRLAFDGWSLYTGNPLDPGQHLPVTQPLITLLEAFSFFLFSTGDVSARIVPAIAGIALLPLIAMLRPVVGRPAVIGMSFLVAISPTIVYTSRLVNSNILLALSAMVIVVAVARAGTAVTAGRDLRRWGLMAGIGVGLLLASGPASISVLISLAIGLIASAALDPHRAARHDQADNGRTGQHSPHTASGINAITHGTRALLTNPASVTALVIGFVVTILTLFSRIFSDLSDLRGIGDIFIDWGRLIGSGATAIPTQYYLLVVLLYELLAVIFAIVAILMPAARSRSGAASDGRDSATLDWPFFVGWFAATLIIFAFSSGRAASDSIQVVLPLVLMGGIGIGRLIETIDWAAALRGGLIIVLAVLGIVAGVVAAAVLASKSAQNNTDPFAGFLQVAIVLIIIVGGMLYLAFGVSSGLRHAGLPAQIGRMVLLAALIFFGALTFRATTELNYTNIANGSELLTQDTPTEAVPAVVNRLRILSRDVSVNRSSVADPLGEHSLRMVIDPAVEWPFRWYFRENTQLTVGDPGTAANTNAEVVIANQNSPVDSAGFTPQTYTYLNRTPAAYERPSFGTILSSILVPTNWDTATQFLFFRTLHDPSLPTSLVVGYDSELSKRLFSAQPETNLFSQSGPGNGDGQLNQPRGIALSSDDKTIYVVDSNNARVERYGTDGSFLGSWGDAGGTSALSLGLFQPSSDATFGAGGMVVGANGNLYVADTWNHVVVVLGADGRVIRRIGQPGAATDNGDDPTNVQANPGLFFGPRGVAVGNNEVYVTDTGNERVQVFGLDGVFRRTFGGFGTAPGQLIEPVGIAVGDDGSVYVADSGNARISVFSSDGTPVAQWPVKEWESARYDPASGGRPNFEPYLTFGPNGLLFASSRISSSVLVFDRNGNEVTSLTDIDGHPLSGPIGIAISSAGDLYVGDADNNAVYHEPLPEINVQTGAVAGGTPNPLDIGTPDAASENASSSGNPLVQELPAGGTPPAGSPDAGDEQSTPAGDVATPLAP